MVYRTSRDTSSQDQELAPLREMGFLEVHGAVTPYCKIWNNQSFIMQVLNGKFFGIMFLKACLFNSLLALACR